MNGRMIRRVLETHALVVGLAGLGFYLFPKALGGLWPWALPPLAARFVGSLLLTNAVYGACSAAISGSRARLGMAHLGVGYALFALVGLLGIGAIGATGRLIIWLLIFGSIALIFTLLPIGAKQSMEQDGGHELLDTERRLIHSYFMVHLVIVAPVGAAMYLFPVWAQPHWAWMMTPINVRLIGTIFAFSAGLSWWCIRQQRWSAVYPALAAYAVFTTTALLASFIHFNLFNPHRPTTWAFVALYVVVAAGAWFLLAGHLRQNRAAMGVVA
ncbi:MAG: hypothetical protein H0X37_12485 [Herpetosiphonaceae bacterium]|nr:hypothetical protein [Herpetosiphonaceae bacterium]